LAIAGPKAQTYPAVPTFISQENIVFIGYDTGLHNFLDEKQDKMLPDWPLRVQPEYGEFEGSRSVNYGAKIPHEAFGGCDVFRRLL
jgi:hypothetical protein